MTVRKGCPACGSSETCEATDNFGQSYEGCAHCRLLTLDEIARLSDCADERAKEREACESVLVEQVNRCFTTKWIGTPTQAKQTRDDVHRGLQWALEAIRARGKNT